MVHLSTSWLLDGHHATLLGIVRQDVEVDGGMCQRALQNVAARPLVHLILENTGSSESSGCWRSPSLNPLNIVGAQQLGNHFLVTCAKK